MRFDWYQATLRVPEFGTYPERLAPVLQELLEPALGPLRAEVGPGRYGYAYTTVLRGPEGDTRCGIYWGGNTWPNVWASGDDSPALAEVLRSYWPAVTTEQGVSGHLVTRADVALDFRSGWGPGLGEGVHGPGLSTFSRLQAELLPIADRKGLSVSQAGDWYRLEKGRTLYVGSRKSTAFCRLYEKGLEQVSKAPCEADRQELLAESDWVRLELVVRPDKEGPRAEAARLEPEALWGFSQWTAEAYERVSEVQVPRYERASLRVSGDEKTLGWLIRQYGPLLARQAARMGGAGSREAEGLEPLTEVQRWMLLGAQLHARYVRANQLGEIHD